MSVRSAIKSIYGAMPIPGKRQFSVWRHERKLEKFRQSLRHIAAKKRRLFSSKLAPMITYDY